MQQLAAGGAHNCVLFDDEAVSAQAGLRYNKNMHCWGLNDSGQTDVPLGYDSGVARVAAGSDATCVIRQHRIDIGKWLDQTKKSEDTATVSKMDEVNNLKEANEGYGKDEEK